MIVGACFAPNGQSSHSRLTPELSRAGAKRGKLFLPCLVPERSGVGLNELLGFSCIYLRSETIKAPTAAAPSGIRMYRSHHL